ncbi:MAG: ABC transporter permease [Desulfobacterales bacterium]|nr:ABC transporter permease [Desulfobacterales bacterium]
MTAQTAIEKSSPARRLLKQYLKNKMAVAGFIGLAAIIFVAVFAPVLSPQDPYDLAQLDIMDSLLKPGSTSMDGVPYILGTDDQGRDILSGIMYGLRTSLGVGALSAFFALIIGSALGLISAFFGGRTDAVIMRVVDLQLSFPAILVALVLMAILGQGVDKIIIALIIVQWAYYARTIRSAALVETQKEYIEAASCLALSNYRIVFRHLLPNCIPPMIVVVTVRVAAAISLEATLSFLGIGLPVTEPSLGLLISNGFEYMLSGRYWISFYPGMALLFSIVSINLVGDHLRDILNPRLQK